MQSSMQVTIHLRARRITYTNFTGLEYNSYERIVEKVEEYKDYDWTVYMGEVIMGCFSFFQVGILIAAFRVIK